MTKSKKLKREYKCWKCELSFISWQARNNHIETDHRPPKKTVEEPVRFGECHSLRGGSQLKVGDPITFHKKGVITKITRTEGSGDIEIEIVVIKDNYLPNQ